MATVTARVIRRGYNRVQGGILVRFQVGQELQVSERELQRHPGRLERVDGPVGPGAHRPEKTKHNLVEMGATLRGREEGALSQEQVDTGAGSENEPAPADALDVSEQSSPDEELLAAQQQREERVARVNAAGDVQSLRLLAYEWGVDVSNRWTADKTRKELLAKI